MKNAHSRTFSERLLYAMEQKDLNRFTLSKLIGTSHTTVGRWLSADGFLPRQATVRMLSDELCVNVQWLLEGEGEMRPEKAKSTDLDSLNAHKVDVRWVPVISWAHAGRATAYDEMPTHWQSKVLVDCRSENVFGLIVEGDSMEPRCVGGDVVIAMPTEEPCNGCLVVAKLKDDGIVLRRYAKINDDGIIRLSAYNPVYPPVDYHPSSFHWIYPIHSTVRSEWPN